MQLGTAAQGDGQYRPSGTSAGIGSVGDNASGVTRSGISGYTDAGDAGLRTGDEQVALAPLFNPERAQAELNAQVTITQAALPQISKAVGDFTQTRRETLKLEAWVAESQGDAEQAERLRVEAARWDEGGSYHVVLHAVVGALTGGASAAVGAGMAAAAAPAIEQFTAELPLPEPLQAVAGMVLASALGAAGGVQGSVQAFNVDANNRQLHPTERQRARIYAERSGGRFTAEQLEDAMRTLGNQEYGENVTAGMVVDPQHWWEQIYDDGARFQQGEGGLLVQILPKVDPEVVAYLYEQTGGLASPYLPPVFELDGLPAQPGQPLDRLTGMPLDDQGRYTRRVVVNGQVHEVKYWSCATAECITAGANIDHSDPATQAFVQAARKQALKDLGTAATLVAMASPVGAAGQVASVVGAGATIAGAEGLEGTVNVAGSAGSAIYMEKVLGIPRAAARRIAGVVDLLGGWEWFGKSLADEVRGEQER